MADQQLNDWQLDIDGVTIGHGTPILIEDIEGIGTPSKRTPDSPIPGEDGSYPGRDLLGARTVRITAGIRTPGDPAAGLDLLAALEATADSDTRLTSGATAVLRIKRPGQPVRRSYGRVLAVEANSLARAVHGWLPVTVTFSGLDPAWYADTVSGVTLPLDVSSTRKQGITAPVRTPITTGVADPTSRPGWATNSGNRKTWPTIRITGPVVGPRVWLEGVAGAVLDFPTLVLRDGERIDIETRPGTRWVLLNGGQGSAAGALSRASRLDQFAVPPGRCEVRWDAVDSTNTSSLAITWRDAYTSV
ncbi:phage tail family protein [Kitasatospora sp. NBC_01287]|uniref:hypothetical protein n=1 Tax=Kitasatospora sp. NBC_01287 TaxID=2903573 RepID=UPI00224E22E5|nr:hypothetical protein [Kitasatospora sp. NBC_01287]MCX4749240.1 phage tail family protein [Kitasatospora sp. NBC_01287]